MENRNTVLFLDNFEEVYGRYAEHYFEALNLQLQASRFTIVLVSYGSVGKSPVLSFFHPSSFHFCSQPVSLSIIDFKLAPTFERKWIDRRLQQINITLPEETGYVDILIMRRAMQLATLEEILSKIGILRDDSPYFPSVTLQAYFYYVAIYLRRLATSLRRFVIAQRRLQYLAAGIHNRVARSPSPFRREPPVGGIKVGGEWSPSSCLLVT